MRQLEYSFASGILKRRWKLFAWVTRKVNIDDVFSIKEATHHTQLALKENEGRNMPSDKEKSGVRTNGTKNIRIVPYLLWTKQR